MAMNYLGDFPTGKTIYVYFNTFDSNDPSASVTLTGLAVTDIEVYKNGSAVQRSSDAGYALLDTDGIDFDGITGVHGFSIDTSDNTDAGFYAAGNDYVVIVAGVTVDAAVVNFVAASFSIENRAASIDLANGTDGLAAISTKITDLQGATFNTATDSNEAIRDRGDAAWTTGAGGSPPQLLQSTTIATLTSQTVFTLTAGSADDDAYNNKMVIVTDQTTSTQKAVGRCSDYVGSTKEVTLSVDPAIFTMAVGDTVDIIAISGSNIPINVDASGNVNLLPATQATIDSISGDTSTALVNLLNTIIAEIGTAGDGLTNMPWNATWDAEVESEVNDALNTVIAELAPGVPPATPTLRTGLMLMFMALRNQLVSQTSGVDALEIYNDAGTLITMKLITDDGSDYTEAKMS